MKRVQVTTLPGSVHHYEVDAISPWRVLDGMLYLVRQGRVIAQFAAGLWLNVEEITDASAA